MIFTSNHFIDVVELIEVEKDSREVGDEEHADNDQQDQGKVKIFGLLQIEMILVLSLFKVLKISQREKSFH